MSVKNRGIAESRHTPLAQMRGEQETHHLGDDLHPHAHETIAHAPKPLEGGVRVRRVGLNRYPYRLTIK